MKKIYVLIGGGEIDQEETKKIDLKIKSLTKKENPKILFFPIAAKNAEGYIETFEKYFHKLGFITDHARIGEESKESIKEKLKESDAIYFGGGDTEYALEQTKKINFMEMLNSLDKKEIVISGISAGALIWCKDLLLSGDEYNPEMKLIEGLKEIDIIIYPHYKQERREKIKKVIGNKTVYGIANKGAIIVSDCGIKEIIGEVHLIK